MKACLQQFLASNHSWSICGQNIARSLLKKGYDVHLCSTNGYENFPKDLEHCVREKLDTTYDLQISYTAMKNFPFYLSHGTKNRFGIWNYEFDVLPTGFAKYTQFTDKFLPSSNFFYDICVKNNIPKEKMCVVPHGVDWERFENATPMIINTNKRVKFLVNFGQAHIRKNIEGTFNAFAKAFTKQDDVCLVIKASNKKPSNTFDVDFADIFLKWKKRFKHHPEAIVLDHYIPNIEELYKACDGLFMLPNSEAFFFPAIEMIASGGFVITSNYGGQLDYLNKDNAFLINGKMIRAPKEAQYWSASPFASMFEPNLNEAAVVLQNCVRDVNAAKNRSKHNRDEIRNKFNWDAVINQLESLMGR